jgi:hypothetical protein
MGGIDIVLAEVSVEMPMPMPMPMSCRCQRHINHAGSALHLHAEIFRLSKKNRQSFERAIFFIRRRKYEPAFN